ncbi:hypothetical protein Pint_03214 [Pistacia integerrima]|uniref:Uncharacterized protein n=1 Tax=Pistacia integerrima TaxID=434235 RepID=A0ACC0ZNL1_9ROSI|nr:hypothetical protein Pint_03214 [Pistacia integerrima]
MLITVNGLLTSHSMLEMLLYSATTNYFITWSK